MSQEVTSETVEVNKREEKDTKTGGGDSCTSIINLYHALYSLCSTSIYLLYLNFTDYFIWLYYTYALIFILVLCSQPSNWRSNGDFRVCRGNWR